MTADEIRSQREKCADCGGQLQEVNVLQNGHYNAQMPIMHHSMEPKVSRWTPTHYPAEGVLLAFKCSACARVAFYAADNEVIEGKPKFGA
ncbi:MAG: hypothetical protein V4671_02210 [Armatimonadota bacterium]